MIELQLYRILILLMQYKLPKSELISRTLWLSVWDWDRFGGNQFLGEVRLPLSSLDLTVSSDQWYRLQDEVYTQQYKNSHITTFNTCYRLVKCEFISLYICKIYFELCVMVAKLAHKSIGRL